MLSLTIVGATELRDLARDLRRATGTIRSELTREFRREGEGTLRRVKSNMTTMDIKGYKVGGRPFREHRSGKGLRRRIAAVTELEVRTGSVGPRVRFVVRTDRIGSARKLPFYLDSGKKWRHPIMGFTKGGGWRGGAASRGKPWFRKTINSDLKRYEAGCGRAIDATVRQIERG
jgi:hypothetical protein